jgi:two-component system response regulator PilR (NtrC family)
MQALRAQIGRLARSQAPIAINGESGSGKELAAREIHAQSARAGKPFVAVNCGAIPEALMEAEFFGYRKGAFTGAADERDGFFQAANGGTLMLDEVADLPLAMQVKLLRAIQERRVRKIGATAEEAVDVRIISATHKDLARLVETGQFRQDLFYRLNVIELTLPPLRERLDDLPLLADAILARLAGPGGARLGAGVLDALRAMPSPATCANWKTCWNARSPLPTTA